jgi:hypothetical protein
MTETVESKAARLGKIAARGAPDREEVRTQTEVTDVASVVSDIAEQYKMRLNSKRA